MRGAVLSGRISGRCKPPPATAAGLLFKSNPSVRSASLSLDSFVVALLLERRLIISGGGGGGSHIS